ncbi:hypothetical protein Pmani_026496 [Petrolisthes manimaculis]|uniref:Uncharacterized protein n=1 Tax=Petrolisthes manimaculis TaxID=1843537 RepID=A0AAE1P3I9_9EUCA|nr:hypothetical protein Pmani_026496 [Petrolisthes manimaculis]
MGKMMKMTVDGVTDGQKKHETTTSIFTNQYQKPIRPPHSTPSPPDVPSGLPSKDNPGLNIQPAPLHSSHPPSSTLIHLDTSNSLPTPSVSKSGPYLTSDLLFMTSKLTSGNLCDQ